MKFTLYIAAIRTFICELDEVRDLLAISTKEKLKESLLSQLGLETLFLSKIGG
jgi:hypothetical protein